MREVDTMDRDRENLTKIAQELQQKLILAQKELEREVKATEKAQKTFIKVNSKLREVNDQEEAAKEK